MPESGGRTLRVATLGAAFSANKGAASMLQAVVDRLGKEVGSCAFSVLTTYPREDRARSPSPALGILPARPAELLLVLLPLALLACLLRLLRLPPGLSGWTGPARALLEADVVLDLAGISFSDGRGVPVLAYNTLMTGVPLLMGRPVVKCSQAMGPFREALNRRAARLVLPRVAALCARGPGTAAHLAGLGLTNVVEAADLAFLMEVPEAAALRARELTAPLGDEYLAVSPSAVVRGYCRSVGIDYASIMVEVVSALLARGERVVLLSHSSRPSGRESRMNDDPLCREIHGRVGASSSLLLLDGSHPPTVLRAVIGGASLLITSRFHAMISALATGTAPVVVGWSHKYQEVMEGFGLAELVLPYEGLSAARILEAVEDVRGRGEEVRELLERGLPGAAASARRNFEAIRHVLSLPRR